jgi:uncharacterized protein YdeI (YjbR/CyaY-like superfamily)
VKVTFFRSSAEFRRWLVKNHAAVTELWVGFYRKDSGKGGITYQEALDEALCFGWIDGLKKKVCELSYTHRFTPRKARSIWSTVNTKRAGVLRKLGRMTPAGLKAFAARDAKRSGIYSFENRPRQLEGALEQKFKANTKAWEFFQAQPPGYRRLLIWRIVSAKKEETRLRRLEQLIQDSAQGKRIGAP